MTNSEQPSEQPPTDDGTVERQRRFDDQRRQLDAEKTTRYRRLFRRSSVASPHGPGWEQRPWTSRLLHRVGELAALAGAGIVAAALTVVWAVVGLVSGFPAWWQTVLYSVTGSVTFVMVFVILHTQDRQTSGTQRKLDELIRSSTRADNTLIAVEEAAEEDLQALAHLNLADREGST